MRKTSDKIIKIDKGVGAAAKNAYNVELPNGRHAKLAAGTIVTKIVVIAGEGTKTPVRVAEYLEDEFGHKAKDWKKVRGEWYIRDGGKNIKVELHWFEANGDRVRMKVKRKLK